MFNFYNVTVYTERIVQIKEYSMTFCTSKDRIDISSYTNYFRLSSGMFPP